MLSMTFGLQIAGNQTAVINEQCMTISYYF